MRVLVVDSEFGGGVAGAYLLEAKSSSQAET